MTATPLRPGQPRLVGSVGKAMKVLHLFAEANAGAGLRVSEVARALRVNKSTASRLLASLAQEGFLVTDDDTHQYYVGPTAYALGSRFSAAPLVRTVRQVLDELSAETGCTSQFGMVRGGRVIFLAVSEGSLRLRVVLRPGDSQFAHASAIGKAILAALPAADADAAIVSILDAGGKLPAVGPRTLRAPDDFRADLRRAAQRGYSISLEESTAGTIGIGAYIGLSLGVPTALSVAYPLLQPQKRQEVAARAAIVKRAAAAAAALLARGGSFGNGGDGYSSEPAELLAKPTAPL